MKAIPSLLDNATLAEYLKEPLSKSLLRHFSQLKELDFNNFEPASVLVQRAEKILCEVYSDFSYLIANVDDPGLIYFSFEMDDSKLPLMAMMVDYYDIEPSPMLEQIMKSLNGMCEQYDREMIDSAYMEHKLEKVKDRFRSIKAESDSKKKMKELILFKQSISWLYFRGIELTTYNMIQNETEMLINHLKELEKLGCLESNPVKSQKSNATPSFGLATKRKTDFIKLLSAMYDNKMFVSEYGNPITNKQKLMEAFGEFLNDDFKAYSTSLSQAKTRDEKTFLKPFREIEKEALRYFNTVGE